MKRTFLMAGGLLVLSEVLGFVGFRTGQALQESPMGLAVFVVGVSLIGGEVWWTQRRK